MQPWDRQEVHTLFDGLEFRVLRERLFETLESEEEIDDSGFALDMTQLEPGQVGDWLAANASKGQRVGVHVEGSWGSGTGDVLALAFATGEGTAASRVGGGHHPRGRRRARLVDRRPRTSPRCCTTPRDRCWRSQPVAGRCAASNATPRCPPTWPDPTSAPTTSPTSPCAT